MFCAQSDMKRDKFRGQMTTSTIRTDPNQLQQLFPAMTIDSCKMPTRLHLYFELTAKNR
jgi:hypothetical protein